MLQVSFFFNSIEKRSYNNYFDIFNGFLIHQLICFICRIGNKRYTHLKVILKFFSHLSSIVLYIILFIDKSICSYGLSFSVLEPSLGAKQCLDENFNIICQARTQLFSDIYYIKIFKNVTHTLNTIVFIKPKDPIKCSTGYIVTWKNEGLQRRSFIDKSIICPLNKARLVLEISKENLEKSDAGVYVCLVSGLTSIAFNDTFSLRKEISGKFLLTTKIEFFAKKTKQFRCTKICWRAL